MHSMKIRFTQKIAETLCQKTTQSIVFKVIIFMPCSDCANYMLLFPTLYLNKIHKTTQISNKLFRLSSTLTQTWKLLVLFAFSSNIIK